MSGSRSVSAYYGVAAISRSLWHFLAGKSFVVASSVAVLFLLAAKLETSAYAAYVSLQAFVVLCGRVSGLGVENAMNRYLPELRGLGNNRAAYRLLWQGMLVRAVLLGSVLGATGLAALPLIIGWLDLNDWLWLVPWYLGVGFLRLMAQYVTAMLETFLWQREAQYPVAFVGALKLAAVLVFLQDLDLALVVAIEFVSEALMLAILLAAWVWRWRRDPERRRGTNDWWRDNRARVVRFGFWGFLQGQSKLLYGSAPNRLMAAHYLPSSEVALYGLADNLGNMVRRFMPTRLFIGLIRPVVMARFSANGDFAQAVSIADLAYRFNLSILVLGIALMTTVGEPLLGALTGGNYAAAAPLVAAMFLLMISEGMGVMLHMLAQAVERNPVLFFTNLVLSASLLVAIPLLPVIGVWALVIANFAGLVLSNLLIVIYLRRCGHRFRVGLGNIASILAYGLASGLLGGYLDAIGVHFLLVAPAICAFFFILYILRPPLTPYEREMLRALLRRKLQKRSANSAANPELDASRST